MPCEQGEDLLIFFEEFLLLLEISCCFRKLPPPSGTRLAEERMKLTSMRGKIEFLAEESSAPRRACRRVRCDNFVVPWLSKNAEIAIQTGEDSDRSRYDKFVVPALRKILKLATKLGKTGSCQVRQICRTCSEAERNIGGKSGRQFLQYRIASSEKKDKGGCCRFYYPKVFTYRVPGVAWQTHTVFLLDLPIQREQYSSPKTFGRVLRGVK